MGLFLDYGKLGFEHVVPLGYDHILFIILHTDLKSWRFLVVFLFGLIHGLGFASILEFIEIPESDLITALFGFNCGVELAQIIVVVICYFVFAKWFSQKDWYRKYLVIPLSIMISGIGLLWTYERLFSA